MRFNDPWHWRRGAVMVGLALTATGSGCARTGNHESSEPLESPAPPTSPGLRGALPSATSSGLAVTMDWVELKPGELQMGSPATEPCRVEHEHQHPVTLTRGFAISSTEVTQQQFQALMGYNPSFATSCGPTCPVERVSWHEAAGACNALSKRHERPSCYECVGGRQAQRCVETVEPIVGCEGYRLPTEAEWEYAARAGSPSTFSGGAIQVCMTADSVTNRLGWTKCNSDGTPHPVARKEPNPWGLYDMHGNVSEWTGDWYDIAAPVPDDADPTGPLRGNERVFRGGDWYHNASHARSAHRERVRPDKRLSYVGFRCVVTR